MTTIIPRRDGTLKRGPGIATCVTLGVDSEAWPSGWGLRPAVDYYVEKPAQPMGLLESAPTELLLTMRGTLRQRVAERTLTHARHP